MTSAEIRQSFLDFFKSKQHTIVPSSSLMPDSPNLLFTNAGMNQFVPIFLGQTKCPYHPPRAADTQKCIRAGGKHNDLDDVGLDTYHHTFFEMLGNWSFGDYFKKEAIEWAWQLVIDVWRFPPSRLYATVYSPDKALGDPSEFDQEAWSFWAEKFRSAGLDPAVHIVNGNKKDNFWMMGETGPCGPCSELHVDLTPNGDTKGSLVNKGDARCIEIWNLVFIQFNAQPSSGGTLAAKSSSVATRASQPPVEFVPLAQKHVDTGMGFERVTSIIQGTKNFSDFANAKISNYETDIFRPIFDKLEKMSGKKYGSTLPGASAPADVGSARGSRAEVGGSPTSLNPQTSSENLDEQRNLDERGVQRAAEHGTPAACAPLFSTEGKPISIESAPGATYSRRRLPHFEKPWAIYHITLTTSERRQLEAADRDIVLDCIRHWNDRRYRLIAACVMPDHTHFIIQPGIESQDPDGDPIFYSLSTILHTIKSYTAHEINKRAKKSGSVWEKEKFDRYIRSDADLEEKFNYLCRNPWDAGLVQPNQPWPWLWTPEIESWRASVAGSARGSRVEVGGPPTSRNLLTPSPEKLDERSVRRAAEHSTPAACAPQPQSEQEKIDIAFRVIADHIRTLSFAIADGIQPGNTDRNYVLRRILRRAVRYGRTLGFHEPFFYKLVDVLADTMGDVFPEIRARRNHVEEVIQREEEAFNKTLDRGIKIFEGYVFQSVVESLQLQKPGQKFHVMFGEFDSETLGYTKTIELSGDFQNQLASYGVTLQPLAGSFAFELYDTYGFPLDLTELMARERGLTVDKEGFEKLMEDQRARARAAQKKEVISLSEIESTTPTKFVGFDNLAVAAKVLEVVKVKDKNAVILDTSSAYAEMGGQLGDTGELSHGGQLWRVVNTQKSGNTWLHFIEDEVGSAAGPAAAIGGSPIARSSDKRESGGPPDSAREPRALPIAGAMVTLSVDRARRNAIQRHHTVTHLLHWALHEIASKEASQKGSYVGPEKLTFDFNSAPLTPEQLSDIEKLVNERILENAGVSWTEVPHADVKSRKDVMQFFGDKYGDTVRVVQIGGGANKLDGYSMELCGGTHTRATGEIGLFRIVGESAIAAGVRRIEAVAGLQAYDRAKQELRSLRSIAGKINSPVGELEKKIDGLLAQQKELENQLKAVQQKQAVGSAKELLAKTKEINGIPAIIENLGAVDGETLQAIADFLKSQFKGVIVLGGVANGAVALVATVSPDFLAKIQAGKIIQIIAPIVGGKGGGKPGNARGGGKDAGKLDEALTKAASLIC